MAKQRRAMARGWCLRDVSTTHLHVLMLLESAPIAMGRLAELIDVSLPNATGIIGRMEERGLVERVRDDADRRLVLVRIADAGRATVEEMELIRRQHLARVLSAMTEEQRACCIRAFRTLRETAERLDAATEDGTDETPEAPPEKAPRAARSRPPATATVTATTAAQARRAG